MILPPLPLAIVSVIVPFLFILFSFSITSSARVRSYTGITIGSMVMIIPFIVITRIFQPFIDHINDALKQVVILSFFDSILDQSLLVLLFSIWFSLLKYHTISESIRGVMTIFMMYWSISNLYALSIVANYPHHVDIFHTTIYRTLIFTPSAAANAFIIGIAAATVSYAKFGHSLFYIISAALIVALSSYMWTFGILCAAYHLTSFDHALIACVVATVIRILSIFIGIKMLGRAGVRFLWPPALSHLWKNP
jgi:hypothetical protein